jgi:hypothetical protein
VVDEGRLKRIEKDLYFGNGKPALTIRMEVMEEKVDSISSNLSKLVWLMVGTLVSSVGGLIIALVTHFLR